MLYMPIEKKRKKRTGASVGHCDHVEHRVADGEVHEEGEDGVAAGGRPEVEGQQEGEDGPAAGDQVVEVHYRLVLVVLEDGPPPKGDTYPGIQGRVADWVEFVERDEDEGEHGGEDISEATVQQEGVALKGVIWGGWGRHLEGQLLVPDAADGEVDEDAVDGETDDREDGRQDGDDGVDQLKRHNGARLIITQRNCYCAPGQHPINPTVSPFSRKCTILYKRGQFFDFPFGASPSPASHSIPRSRGRR